MWGDLTPWSRESCLVPTGVGHGCHPARSLRIQHRLAHLPRNEHGYNMGPMIPLRRNDKGHPHGKNISLRLLSSRTRSLVVGGLLLTAMTARVSTAQSSPFDQFLQPRFNGVHKITLQFDADPDVLVFDDTTRTATLTFINPTERQGTVWIAPECGGDGKPQPDDPVAAAWHNSYPCATPWLSGYPQRVALAPHTRRTVSVQVIPYPTLPDGHYTARLITNGTFGHDEIVVEYHKGPKRPRRPRAHWSATAPAALAGTLVQSTPSVVVVDPSSHAAQFTLRNPAATATEVWLILDVPWFRIGYSNIAGDTWRHSSQYEQGWHLREPNIAMFFFGYPQHVVLAPHEQRTITLQLDTGEGSDVSEFPAGSYYTQVRYVQPPVLTVTKTGDTTFSVPQGTVDVVYHRKSSRREEMRPFSMSQVSTTQHANGTWTACVTLQQPGIGLIASLHAKVRGGDSRDATPSKLDTTVVWTLDTTVVVWEVMHHDRADRLDAGKPRPPDPVCFSLPDFNRGLYLLEVSAVPLGASEDGTRGVLLDVQ